MKPLKIQMSWSGGKDCVLALDLLRRDPSFDVVELVSGFCRDTGRIGIHEVRRELVRAQAESLGLPLSEIELPMKPSNAEYEAVWGDFYQKSRKSGIAHVAYGDLFLEEIRAYRERFLASIGMHAVFPLWGQSTSVLARDALEVGLRAVICSCDFERLDRQFVGRIYDRQFLDDLPVGCDPCGENGEFHTFVFDGPGYKKPVAWERGGIHRRGTVDFCDLLALQLQ